jgi:hypothetical protein
LLPHISDALARFLSPIASFVKSDSHSSKQKGQGFERHKDKKGEPAQEAPQTSSTEEASKAPQPDLKLVHSSSNQQPSMTQTLSQPFFEIISLFQTQKDKMNQGAGVETYKANTKKQKKTGKFRKGSILDEQAE